MKITRDKALAMTAYCRRMGLHYASEGQYPNSVSAGRRAGTKAPNGVSVHFPKVSRQVLNRVIEAGRAYVLWQGESVEAIEEACAFILMTRIRCKEIYVVRCKHASQGVKDIEALHTLEAEVLKP